MQRFWQILKKTFLYLFVLQFVYLLFCKWINPPITITQLNSLLKGNGLQRDYVDFDEMSTHMKLAVIASEDQLFADHNGFDTLAIKKAFKYNAKHPNKRRGASTISQQVAKNVFLWQGGGYFRKGLEVYFTFMIELLWSKKRILEVYLNIAETGKGVFGVEAAAQKYFHVPAKNLSKAQAAMIAAALPNPKIFTIVPLSRYVSNRYDDIMHQMTNLDGDEDIDAIVK
jgi:monofunctional glycosyltransferase